MLRLLVLLVLVGVSQHAEGFALGDGVATTPEVAAATTIINECSEIPFDVVFVLDSSGSVGPQNFTVMKNFVKTVTGRLNIGVNGTHVGVITYSGYPSMRIRLTDYLDQASLDKAVDAIPYITGITETHMALDMLAGEGFIGARPGIARVGIVMTDGMSLHPSATGIAALNAQSQGINLFAVGIGPEINLDELSVIATDPDVQHIFRVLNFNELQNIVHMISTRTCKAKYIETSVTPLPPLSTVTPAYINETKNATVKCNETLADILFILDTSGSVSETSFKLVKQFVVNIINDLDIGKNQTMHSIEFECNETLADILFILDTSGSVSETSFQLVKQFVINIINDLDIGENQTKVGVITYSSYPVIGIKLGEYSNKLDLLNAVNTLNYYPGATATDAALDLARNEGFKGERPAAPNIAIVVTDGYSTQPQLTKIAAEGIKLAGTTVFSIGVGDEIDKDELNFLSSDPNTDYVFFVANFTDLSSIEKNVAKTTCEVPLNPVLVGTTQSPGATTQGQKATSGASVVVTGGNTQSPTATGGTPELTPALVTQTSGAATSEAPEITPSTTQGPTGTTPEPCFAKIADVMFVVDSSGSVGPNSFELVKKFIKQMIDVFDVSKDYTRVGVITFNIRSTIQFKLGQFNNATEIKQAIDQIIFTAGGTNTGEALENLRQNGFNNARAGVPNIAIVITDGLSNDPAVTKIQARILKETGDTMIAIGVGNETNSEELKNIASVDQATNKSLVYQVGSFEALQTLNSTVPYSACQVVAPTSIPTTVSTEPPTTAKCGDTISNCRAYPLSVCSDYKPWANANCAGYCGFCGDAITPPPCVNKITNCVEYGSYICETTSVSRWARENCPLYCHFCTEPVATASTEQTAASTASSVQASTAKSSSTVSPASVTGEPITESTAAATATPEGQTPVSVAQTTAASASPASVTGEPASQATAATASPMSGGTPSLTTATTVETPSPPTNATTAAGTVKIESPSPPTSAATTVETPAPPTSGATTAETPAPPTNASAATVETPSPPATTVATGETPSPPTSAATTAEPPAPTNLSASTVETPSPPVTTVVTGETPSPPPSAVTPTETPPTNVSITSALTTAEPPAPTNSTATTVETPSPPVTNLVTGETPSPLTTAETPAPTNSSASTVETPSPPATSGTTGGETPSSPTTSSPTTTETPAPTNASASTVETPSPPATTVATTVEPPASTNSTATTVETPSPPATTVVTGETPSPPSSSATTVETPSPPATSVATGGETPSPPTSGATSGSPIASTASASPTNATATVVTQQTASPASIGSTQSTAGTGSPGTEPTAASVTASVTTGEPTPGPPSPSPSPSSSNTTTGSVVTDQSTAGPTTAPPSPVVTQETTPQVIQTTSTTPETCTSKVADLMFVIDSSGSVGHSSFENIKNFIKQSIDVFDIGTEFTRIGVITYNSQPTLQFALNTYNTSAAIINAIDGIQFTAGSTNTGGALEMLRSKGFLNERPRVPNIAIVITDGLSNNPPATVQQARLAKDSGNILIAIGVGNMTDQVELAKIASVDRDTGKEMVFQVISYEDLQNVQNTVVKYACNVAAATNPPPITVVTTPGPVNTTQPAPQSCANTISNCGDYGRGVCFDYQPWASAHCPEFCGFCQPTGNVTTTPKPCVDNINNCHEYGTYICTSSSLASWTEKNCFKYCGLCAGGSVPTEPPTTPAVTAPAGCDDLLPNCAEYGGPSVCTSATYRPWANKNCRKYCGFCAKFEVKPGVTLGNNQTCPSWRLPSECTMVQSSDDCCPLPNCPEGYQLTVKLPNEN